MEVLLLPPERLAYVHWCIREVRFCFRGQRERMYTATIRCTRSLSSSIGSACDMSKWGGGSGQRTTEPRSALRAADGLRRLPHQVVIALAQRCSSFMSLLSSHSTPGWEVRKVRARDGGRNGYFQRVDVTSDLLSDRAAECRRPSGFLVEMMEQC